MNFFKKMDVVSRFCATIPAYKEAKKEIYEARATGDREKEQETICKGENKWSDELFRKIDSDVNIIGTDNLPKNGPIVFIANHQGYGDVPALMKALRTFQIGFIAKSVFKKIPIVGTAIHMVRGLFIERNDARAALKVIQEGCELLKQGYNMVIFPEGTRSQADEIGDFKPGSFKLATKVGVPIVPITIDGTYKLYERQGYLCPGTVNVIIHKPIPTKGLSRDKQIALVDKVKKIIQDGFKNKKRVDFDTKPKEAKK